MLEFLDVVGPASLFHLDQDGILPAHQGTGVEQLAIGDGGLTALPALSGEEETSESGLEDISSPAFCLRRGDEVVAAAGYLSVLVAPHCRGNQLAWVVASIAVAHALDAGLLSQRRARPYPSQRVAVALGFQELGAQLSVRLGDVPVDRGC
ncbi:GCN5-related N-acetyltransferase [Streptomyces sp. NPDC059970]|uniref:GCN5-related N-acetyltransferase n=1 Tax=Streptomyces sp. NPDC059970 TaxID=3347019 RepID=UPI003690105B